MSPKIPEIVAAVSAHYGVAKMDIMSRRREEDTTHARHVCFWLAKEVTEQSFPQIGAAMNRDHTSVMHGVSAIDTKRTADSALQADLHELVKRLEDLAPSLPDLVNIIRYVSPEILARELKKATLATGGIWSPPCGEYGNHLFVVGLYDISASGFGETEACHYWRKIALKTVDAQAA